MQSREINADFFEPIVNKKLYRLQRKLFDNTRLREQFNSEWQTLHGQGVPMREAICKVRDEWLRRTNETRTTEP